MCTNTSIYLVVKMKFISQTEGDCQWSQWFDVTAAGVVTEAIMWSLSSIQLVALTVTTKGL